MYVPWQSAMLEFRQRYPGERHQPGSARAFIFSLVNAVCEEIRADASVGSEHLHALPSSRVEWPFPIAIAPTLPCSNTDPCGPSPCANTC